MNREAAKNELESGEALEYTPSTPVCPLMNMTTLIDEIYDDFESRTCENCEYYINNINHVGCHFDFSTNCGGCNRFERKDAE